MLRICPHALIPDDYVVAVAADNVVWAGSWTDIPEGLGVKVDTLIVGKTVYRRVVEEIATNVHKAAETSGIVGHA